MRDFNGLEMSILLGSKLICTQGEHLFRSIFLKNNPLFIKHN